MESLLALGDWPLAAACDALGITTRQAGELERNASVWTAPAAEAHSVYDGVLFDALDFAGRSPALRRRISEAVLVQSALFGLVGLGDRIPAYRCSADSQLPGLGRAATYWQPHLANSVPRLLEGHCVIDMRSGAYAGMWQPAPGASAVVVRVMQDRGGHRVAASHFNKATKGLLVADLCASRAQLDEPTAVARALAKRDWEVRLERRAGQVAVLEVLMRSS